MRVSDLISTALASLRQRLFRTMLTVLGVVIGTMAVVVMVSLGVGMTDEIVGSSNDNPRLTQVTVTGVSSTGPKKRSQNTVLNKSVQRELAGYPGVKTVVPVYTVDARITYSNYSGMTSMMGIKPQDAQALRLDMGSEAFPTSTGSLEMVTPASMLQFMYPTDFYGTVQTLWDEQKDDIEGKTFFAQFTYAFNDDSSDMSGYGSSSGSQSGQLYQPTRIKRVPVRLLRVLNRDDTSSYDTSSYVNFDALVAELRDQAAGRKLPGQTSVRAADSSEAFIYSQMILVTDTPDDAEALTTALREDGWEANSEIEVIKMMASAARIIQAVFGAIGGISLLVAAIGIANTMLMSVYERTKQIGIMKVLGASLADIRNLFLIESAGIGFFGGVIGLLLSYIASFMTNSIFGGMASSGGSDVNISIIPLWLAIGAVIFATLVGTVAGMIPANRAMKLSPLAAIRAE